MTKIMNTRAAKVRADHTGKPAVKGVIFTVAVFAAWFIATALTAVVIDPFVPGWNECAIQVGLRLPVGLAAYGILRKSRPVEQVRKIEKKHFRRLRMFYMFLIQIPVQCAFPYFAGAADAVVATESPYALLLNQFVLAPFIEELVMRGVFFNLSRKKLGFWPAAITNAALFAVMHLSSVPTMGVTFLMGLLYCSLYEMTGHIRYGIALHFTFNILALPMMFIAPFVPFFVSIPLLVMAVVLHFMLSTKKDVLEARLFPAA